MELKLILLLLPAALMLERSSQRDPRAGKPTAQVAARNAVRLCGNALKKAIIYSCGASRWKREEMDPPSPESVQIGSNKALENEKLQSNSDPELKHPQGEGPEDREPSWSELREYYMDDKRNIPEVKDDEDLENDPDLKQVRRDHPPDAEPSWSDFLDLYNDKEDIATGAEGAIPDQKGPAKTTGSDFPQAKVKRKRDSKQEMATRCCDVGCTTDDITTTFCS